MIGVQIDAAYADGETLDTLGRLLMRRAELLGESSKDAAVAIVINTLKSVRSRTATAIKRTSFKGTVVEDTGWYGGFSGKAKTRVIRAGHKPDSPRVNVPESRIKWITGFEKKQSKRRVYRVTPEHRSVKPYYVVASSKTAAKNFEKRAAQHRAGTYGNLAKNALGVAMNKLSTRQVDNAGKAICKNAASRLAAATVTSNGTVFEVRATDALAYAIPAIKGGRETVTVALKLAGRKMAGHLAQIVKKRGLKEKIVTPFPEVARKR